MRYIFAFLLIFSSTAFCGEITVYNTGQNGFALISDQVTIQLDEGENNYQLNNVTDQIIVNSLVINNDDGVELLIQDYKPDRTNYFYLLENSIDKTISIIFEDAEPVTGKLLFFDHQYLNVVDANSDNLIMIAMNQVVTINFIDVEIDYESLKPALFWNLYSPRNLKTDIDYSYLSKGMNWEACYNGVWNEDTEMLKFNSQVVVSNNTSKNFPLSKLKLVAGDVNLINQPRMNQFADAELAKESVAMGRGFSRETLGDFHLYSLQKPLSLPPQQSRQVQLYPPANIKAKKYYSYTTHNNHVNGVITFKNSEDNGLGKPIPSGKVRMYSPDKENTNQFIADINIANSSVNQDIELEMGKAFDIKAKTIELSSRRDSRNNVIETDYLVEIDNLSKKDAPVKVRHYIGHLNKIYDEDFKYSMLENNYIEFEVLVKAESTKKINWSQRK